jgi:hypothetical protein
MQLTIESKLKRKIYRKNSPSALQEC